MLKDFFVDKIDNLKGQDIITIDVRCKSNITGYVIVCTGCTSSRHVMSITDHVMQASRAAGLMLLRVDGKTLPTRSSSIWAT